MFNVTRRSIVLSTLASVFPLPGTKAGGYPERPINVIVPYAAGGAGDILIRLIAEEAEKKLGHKLIVVARPGAGGNIGAQAVASAEPDGYTLLLGATNNFVINQYLFKAMNFDPLEAFVPITLVASVPSVIYTHPSLPVTTLPEFIAYAKTRPGKLNFGSPSFGTTPHLAVERLKLMSGIDLVHVAFQGAPPAIQALLRNDIQLYLGGASLGQAHVEAGALRALAISSPKRSATLSNVPTLVESGIADFGAANWWGLAAPKATSKEIIERLYAVIAAVLSDPKVQDRLEKLGYVAGGERPDEFAARLKREAVAWSDTITKANIEKK